MGGLTALGLAAMMEALLENSDECPVLPRLKKLSLFANMDRTCCGVLARAGACAALGRLLARLQTLEDLDLSKTGLGAPGLEALMGALLQNSDEAVMPALRRLVLDSILQAT